MSLKNLIKQWFNLIEVEALESERNHYAELELQYMTLSKKFSEMLLLYNNSEQELREELTKTIEKKEQAEKQIQELLKKDEVDILSLKDWYENNRSQEPWRYNGVRLGTADVKLYLQPSDMKPFIDLAKQLIKTHKLTKKKTPTEIITKIYDYWVYSKWTYITDRQQFGSEEYWEDPTQVIQSRKSDCESKAMVMYWNMVEALKQIGYEEHIWRLTFVASMVTGEGGHAFLTWLHSDGEYYVIESTYDQKGSYLKTWLKTPVRNNNMYKDFWGFATYYKSWKGKNNSLIKFKD